MRRLVEIALLDPDLQQCLAPGLEPQGLLFADQLAGHQGEQIGRFPERVFPQRIVPAIAKITLLDQVAV